MLTLHGAEGMVFSEEPPSVSPLCPLPLSPAIPEGLEPTQPWKPRGPQRLPSEKPIQPLWGLPGYTGFQSTEEALGLCGGWNALPALAKHELGGLPQANTVRLTYTEISACKSGLSDQPLMCGFPHL